MQAWKKRLHLIKKKELKFTARIDLLELCLIMTYF